MIFLDMDGVLCDFVSAAYAAHGRVFDPDAHPRGVWHLEKVLDCTTKQFWQKIDFAGESFWENLEPYPWCHRLVKELQHFGDLVIATSPANHPGSYSGKRRWLQKMGLANIPSMFGSKKYLMAQEGRILVDDSNDNCARWDAAGGTSILVPQPWNDGTLKRDDVVEHVLASLGVE